jgi:hypothetical protein
MENINLKFTINKFLKIVENSTFVNDGDGYEKKYSYLFENLFPNNEKLWKYFVVPYTKRIIIENKDDINRIIPRDNISEDIIYIGSLNYSIFLRLVYAHDHINNSNISSLEDFYYHLGTICDLAEDLLIKIYLLIINCKSMHSDVLQKLEKNDFLDIASQWFEENYHLTYEHYLNKGKFIPIKLPQRNNILKEYFKGEKSFEDYTKYTEILRPYRNFFTHNIIIGKVIKDSKIYIPKPKFIGNFKEWSKLVNIYDNENFEKFIIPEEQMLYDFEHLQEILNKLWDKAISDMYQLLYIENNALFLNKYLLEFIEESNTSRDNMEKKYIIPSNTSGVHIAKPPLNIISSPEIIFNIDERKVELTLNDGITYEDEHYEEIKKIKKDIIQNQESSLFSLNKSMYVEPNLHKYQRYSPYSTRICELCGGQFISSNISNICPPCIELNN